MKHRIGYNRLGRKASHRRAMTRNMLTSLFKHERIRTTKAKALAVRRTAEKMITRAKLDSVHNRRIIGKDIKDQAVLAKIFTEIGPRFKERPGGYTRVLKLGPRPSDAAEMVILELVAEEVEEKKGKKKPASKGAAKESAAPKKRAKAEAAKAETAKPEAAVADTVEAPTESETPVEQDVEAGAESADSDGDAAEESAADETVAGDEADETKDEEKS